jgi:formylmethanofuran dehydrogenase subunit A
MSASIWYRSTSWKDVSDKAEEIAEYIVKMAPPSIEIDNGRLYISKGTPFAQRMSEPSDDMVRRIYININAEFLTAF